ncbi:mitochondrial import inner membrane translocase subunit TIM50-like protein [Tanacetum coccineum]
MSIVSRRILSILLKRNKNPRLYSTVTANGTKGRIVSSSILSEELASSTPHLESAAAGRTGGKPLSFLKYTVLAAFTGGVATAGYATYAYTLQEVDEKTKAFRASAKVPVGDDSASFDVRAWSLGKGQLAPKRVYGQGSPADINLLEKTCDIRWLFIEQLHVNLPVSAKLVELYLDLRSSTEEHVREFTEPMSEKLLPDLHPLEKHVFTLVLDLNETLLYSDWKRDRGWRTFKRPGVDDFLEHLSRFYEIIVYSDQQQMYVDPVIERLDPKQIIRARLSRVATRYQDGKHYRDLSKLNRDPSRILYLSGNALENCLQPENCVPLKPWKCETEDTALVDLIPFLEYVALNNPADIRKVLASYQGRDIAKEFIERTKEHRRRMEGQRQQGRLWRR